VGSEGGQLLQESLILSENAQKFGIARDYLHVRQSLCLC